MDLKIFESRSLALLTDLYQLTMVYAYWKAGIAHKRAAFHLQFRRWPFGGGYGIAAGLETAIGFIERLRFDDPEDLEYLASLKTSEGAPLFEPPFFEFLRSFTFSCDVDAVPEGTAVFPHAPFLRVVGPLWQAQLLESPLLNLLNFQTLIATKAARICRAAAPDPVIEFGMRRAQGVDGAVSASRAAYIGGCAATSHLLAGKLFNIPVRGTHAHSWVMAFPTESEAFARFGEALPVDCTFLIDTYDSVEGARRACKVAKAHPEIRFAGVRLDSGDLARLSRAVRKVLDEEGFSQAKIMASNELDEYLIRDLKHQGAKIDVWGVGTHLVTAKGQSALDGIYKLSAIEDESGQLAPKLKVSEQVVKTTNPGVLQVRRFASGCDLIFDETLGCGSGKMPFAEAPERRLAPSGPFRDLLIPIFRQGRRVYTSPSLIEMQEEAKRQLDALPIEMTRLTNPEPYPVLLDRALYERKRALIEEVS